MENLAALVRGISFFAGLSREDLARVIGKLQEQKFTAGEVIVKQGTAGDGMYLIQSGAVEVVLEQDGLRVESVALLGPNDFFGEMSLFTRQQRSATIQAIVDTVVLKLTNESWEELLRRHLSISWFLPYQTDSCQIAYYITDEKGFTHAQARKLMMAKFLSSLIAVTISVPCWTMLGFIR